MKALCVKQPWAELIASAKKGWEVRTWATDYRGPLLILASAQPAKDEAAQLWASEPRADVLGATVCLVTLRECSAVEWELPQYRGNARCSVGPDDFIWSLYNPVRLPAIPVKGRLGLFDPPQKWLRQLIEAPDISVRAQRMLLEYLSQPELPWKETREWI